MVCISNDLPYTTDYSNQSLVLGVTYYNYGIIWLDTNFESEDFAHECGHVLDKYLGDASNVGAFTKIYKSSWNTYVQKDLKIVNHHAVSNAAEFFAMVFAEYVCYPDYLNQNMPTGYEYMGRITNEEWRFTPWGEYLSFYVRCGSLLSEMGKDIVAEKPFKAKYIVIQDRIQNNPNINLDQYDPILDTSCLSADSNVVVEQILDISNNPDRHDDLRCERYKTKLNQSRQAKNSMIGKYP